MAVRQNINQTNNALHFIFIKIPFQTQSKLLTKPGCCALQEMHLTKMMATIFLIFALSYFPCTVSTIIDWNTMLSKRFHMFCLITVYMGSAVNPLIYGLMNSQFRRLVWIFFSFCCRLVLLFSYLLK